MAVSVRRTLGKMQLLYYSLSPQPRDLRRPEPEPAQHLLRVLAEAGRRRADRRRRVRELDRRPGHHTVALPHHHPPVPHLRVGERLLERVDRPEADLLLAQLRPPLGERLRAEGGAEEAEHLLALLPLVPLYGDEVLAPEVTAEGRPEMLLVGADRDVAAVARLVDGVAGVVPGELRPATLGRTPGEHVEEHVVDVPRDRPVQHGDVDELSPAGPLARDERRQDADRGHERAAAEVRDWHARDDGRAARLAHVVEHAGVAQVVDVVAHPVAVRAVLAVARD